MAARHRFAHNKKPSTGFGSWSVSQPFSAKTEDPDLGDCSSEDDSKENLETMSVANRDRTNEFHAILKSIKVGKPNGVVSQLNPKTPLVQRSEFSKFAKKIGQDLARTYEKLEKLTLLCKKRTLFDDRPVEIQELTYIIKQDITSLKKHIQQLEDNKSHLQSKGKKDLQRHGTSVVRTLRSKLANMSESFKSVLEVRRENMKQQKLRKDQFSSSNLSSSMPLSAAQGTRGSVLLMDEQRSNAAESVVINMDGDYGNATSQYQTMQLVQQQDNYITERAETMDTIESTIVELGGIFQQLATLVKEQEEQVLRIDSSVEESELNVQAAHSEILKYFQGITSNRWLMIKVFLVLIVFFVVFVVFFA